MTGRYMMATTAHHKIGDISRDEPDLAVVLDEDDDAYIGRWVAGFGFFNVRFPKATTRELTADERRHYANSSLILPSGDVVPVGVSAEGDDAAVAE